MSSDKYKHAVFLHLIGDDWVCESNYHDTDFDLPASQIIYIEEKNIIDLIEYEVADYIVLSNTLDLEVDTKGEVVDLKGLSKDDAIIFLKDYFVKHNITTLVTSEFLEGEKAM